MPLLVSARRGGGPAETEKTAKGAGLRKESDRQAEASSRLLVGRLLVRRRGAYTEAVMKLGSTTLRVVVVSAVILLCNRAPAQVAVKYSEGLVHGAGMESARAYVKSKCRLQRVFRGADSSQRAIVAQCRRLYEAAGHPCVYYRSFAYSALACL